MAGGEEASGRRERERPAALGTERERKRREVEERADGWAPPRSEGERGWRWEAGLGRFCGIGPSRRFWAVLEKREGERSSGLGWIGKDRSFVFFQAQTPFE